MQLRCYRCSWSFAMGREEIEFVLKSLEEIGGDHYDARCPRCRTTNKVPVEQLRRAVPRETPPAPKE